MKLTGTNRPITYTTHPLRKRSFKSVYTMKQGKKINKTACVHYVVPKQQTKNVVQGTKTQQNNNTTML